MIPLWDQKHTVSQAGMLPNRKHILHLSFALPAEFGPKIILVNNPTSKVQLEFLKFPKPEFFTFHFYKYLDPRPRFGSSSDD